MPQCCPSENPPGSVWSVSNGSLYPRSIHYIWSGWARPHCSWHLPLRAALSCKARRTARFRNPEMAMNRTGHRKASGPVLDTNGGAEIPRGRKTVPQLLRVGLLAAFPAIASASDALSVFGISAGKNASTLSSPMQIVILLTLLTLLPAAVMCITPFLRITIVLHFLRQALGTQSAPSNQVLLGLSLFLTIVIMQPVAAQMYHQGWEPMENGQLTAAQAFDAGTKPLQGFLVK